MSPIRHGRAASPMFKFDRFPGYILLFLMFALCGASGGELTQLVKDFNPEPRPSENLGFPPLSITEAGGRLYFIKQTNSYGTELWKSDGTPDGSGLVKDINPGDGHSYPLFLTEMGGVLYFSVTAGPVERQGLWRTDGTEAGTVLLKEGLARQLVAMGGRLYFELDGGLWKTDGTPAGTGMVVARETFSVSGGVRHLMSAGGRLFFSVVTENNKAVWTSDGTAAGTVMVKDGFFGSQDDELNFSEWNGEVYFTSFTNYQDGSFQTELWKSDGTESGTVMVKGFSGDPELLNGWPGQFTPVDGSLYFVIWKRPYVSAATVTDELWKTDGTEAGTVKVKTIVTSNWKGIVSLRRSGDGVCFLAVSQSEYSNQFSLWRSDGTEQGTAPADLTTFDSWFGDSGGELMPYDGKFYLVANGPAGLGLYVTDGTAGGTSLVLGHPYGWGYHSLPYLSSADGLYFQVSNSLGGYEIWKTDGTTAGTRLFQDIETGTNDSWINFLAPVGDKLYVGGRDRYDALQKSWRTDGSLAGITEMPIRIESSGLPGWHATVGDTLYFRGLPTPDSWNYGIWKINDSTGALTLIQPLQRSWQFPYFQATDPPNFTRVGERMYYTAQGGLYQTDIASSNPVWLLSCRDASLFGALGGELYFSATTDGEFTQQLWRTDGTPSGTRLVTPRPGIHQVWQKPVAVSEGQGVLYFVERDAGAPTYGLHRTDGTPGGTYRLCTIEGFGRFRAMGDKIFFSAVSAEAGNALWVTDGTIAGTRVVRSIVPDNEEGHVAKMEAIGGRIVFQVYSSAFSTELWSSDGTEEGTFMIKGIGPGPSLTSNEEFTVFNGRLIFSADDGIHGVELWETDGTAEGTRLLADVTGDSGTSAPRMLTSLGQDLYFIAHTEATGRELFIYSAGEAAAPSVTVSGPRELRKNSFILDISVNPNRSATTATVEFGPTPAYGSTRQVALSPVDGKFVQAESFTFAGLSPATTYYYRVRASNAEGSYDSGPLSLTTPANRPPMTLTDDPFGTIHGEYESSVPILNIELLYFAWDPEGYPIEITGIGAAASGASIVATADGITYTPKAGFSGRDLIPITYKDDEGATATLDIVVMVGGPFGFHSHPSVLVRTSSGEIHLFHDMIVGKRYLLQRSVDLTTWEDLESKVHFVGPFVDKDPPQDKAFYRLKYLGSPPPP